MVLVSLQQPRDRERADRARRTEELVESAAEAKGARREAILDELVRTNMGVARSIAARYRHRGVPLEDLEQVAYLALVRVADTYDASRGYDFMSYAVPSIRGEVRRYFRDQGWMIRPPRRVQEMQGRLAATESELSTELGHPPTAEELAHEMDEPVEDVEEAMSANGCFTPTSLDQPTSTEASSIGDQMGAPEAGLSAAEARVVLAPVVRRLTPRERKILEMRFFADRTQKEIGEEIGVTQMQVSRLLSGLLARLREELEASAS